MNLKSLIVSFLIVISCTVIALGQNRLKGVMTDEDTGETLIGASILIKGTSIGAATDFDGKWELNAPDPPFTLVVSYLGYKTIEIEVKEISKNLKILLSAESVSLASVEIVNPRLSEKQKESPLTLESMDLISIKETPATNFYDGMGALKEVDLTSASMGFKIINTRGFNSTSPVRSLQLIDGVDNQAPGLNFSLGNFLGASELDIQRVDLIVGASSAMFGPNAFNGVINMKTKSPFFHKGLSVLAKGGDLFQEIAVRYAGAIANKDGKDKFGYKFNVYCFRANDWKAENYDATAQSLVSEANWGGYDAINIYGDENLTNGTNNFSSDYGKRNFPGLGIFHRTGYKEADLVDYNTRNIKLSGSLHYLIKDDIEAIYAYNFGTGTTVYQGDNRYSLKDILFQQNRIEISKPDKFFIRAYNTKEDAGKSYDAVFTALLMQEAAKSNSDWSKDYSSYYLSNNRSDVWNLPGFPNPQVNPSIWFGDTADSTYAAAEFVMQQYSDSMVVWHQAARDYADGVGNTADNVAFFEPGTARFDSLFKEVTSRTTFAEGGSRFYDKSALSHIQAEYKFTPEFMNILFGGSFRQYRPDSKGTIFSDTNGVVITNSEFGFYSSIDKRIINEKIILTGTARVDKNQNFDYLFSPALSAVYRVTDDHILRFSFSSAIRNPTIQDQYLYYNVGRAILIGNINGMDSVLVTPTSLFAYYNSLNQDTLEFFDVPAVMPEKVKTCEIGFKGTFFENIFIDASYYYSWYRDFIGYKIGSTTPIDTAGNFLPVQFYRVATNSKDVVTTQGVGVAVSYFFKKYYSITGNYSYNVLDLHGSDDPIIPAYNTPKHKFNLGFGGRDIFATISFMNKIWEKIPVIKIKHFGFNINYKWVDGFDYEGSPQFTGYIPSYDMLDAQLNYKIVRFNTTIKLGGSNLLNNQKFQAYGGPFIGRMLYMSILVEI